MCIMALALELHPDYPFIFAGNRDEFYRRPTQPASWWRVGETEIWGGRDLEGGGTWLAMGRDRDGSVDDRFAAVTNVRDPLAPPGELSRGRLVSGFFEQDSSPRAYLDGIAAKSRRYSPFNLVVGRLRTAELWYLSSAMSEPLRLERGLHVLSNGTLNEPWPKVTRLKNGFNKILTAQPTPDPGELEAELLRLLSDPTRADDKELPRTGVSLAWERVLSPIFIQTPDYGTRSSSVILMNAAGQRHYFERQSTPDSLK